MRWGQVGVYGAASLALGFLTIPVLALLLRGVQEQAWIGVPVDVLPPAIGLSFATTGVSLLLTAAFGTPLAFVLARSRFRLKRLVNTLVELPIVLPPAVAGLALLIAFGRRGVIGGVLDDAGIAIAFTTTAVILAQCFVAAPLYVRAAQVGFMSVPKEIEDAARVDGADGFMLFRLITLPLARRAIAAGLVLSWARALGEFGATLLFAGSLQGRTQTMPLLIYNIIERDIDAAIWTGIILIGLALVALAASQWLSPREHNDEPGYGVL